MNERLEIEGDLWDEYREECEREDCHQHAPQQPEWTDAEIEDFYQQWLRDPARRHK
jgi:hypothetical protein